MMLEIDGWKVGMKFSAAHFIPEHGKCSRIHGHDYGVRIRIFGEVERGILFDFVELKKSVRRICDELDHHVLIPGESIAIDVKIDGDRVIARTNGKEYSFPKSDVVFVDVSIPSAEELARFIGKRIISEVEFPENVKGVEVCVDEGPGQGACEYFAMGD